MQMNINCFGGRCTSAAATKHSIKKKAAGNSSHFRKAIKASENFHTEKMYYCASIMKHCFIH